MQLDKYFKKVNEYKEEFEFIIMDQEVRNQVVSEYRHLVKIKTRYYNLYVHRVNGNTVYMKRW